MCDRRRSTPFPFGPGTVCLCQAPKPKRHTAREGTSVHNSVHESGCERKRLVGSRSRRAHAASGGVWLGERSLDPASNRAHVPRSLARGLGVAFYSAIPCARGAHAHIRAHVCMACACACGMCMWHVHVGVLRCARGPSGQPLCLASAPHQNAFSCCRRRPQSRRESRSETKESAPSTLYTSG